MKLIRLVGRLVLLVGFVIAAALVAQVVGRAWYAEPPPWRECGGSLPGSDAFDDCVNDVADLVESFDYPEFKDLAKTFLVLLSATLVSSMAFSERLLDPARAPPRATWLMMIGWILLVLGIAACAVGLAFMSNAASTASGLSGDFQVLAQRATTCLFFSIGAYVMALVAWMGASAASIAHRRVRPVR